MHLHPSSVRRLLRLFSLLLLLSLLAICQLDGQVEAEKGAEFDILIRGGQILDGTGSEPFMADLGIKDGRVTALGQSIQGQAKRTIEAKGLCVAPGFIDVHTHADEDMAERADAWNFLHMGVTTIVTGNCGGSVGDFDKHFELLEEKGISVNYASLVGHNTVRRAVMGSEPRKPSPEELEKMKRLVDQAMQAGAMGLSTGLIYIPGVYAETEEIIELAKATAKYGGVYASHMRNEAEGVLESIDEALRIGREAGVRVHLSHLKASGKNSWGLGKEIVAKMRKAREAGLRLSGDQYSYTASSTGIDVLFPARALSIGRKNFAARLKDDEAFRQEMFEALMQTIPKVGFRDFEYCQVASAGGHTDLSGKNLKQIAKLFYDEDDPEHQARAAIKLYIDSKGQSRISMIYRKMDENDVETIMRAPFISVASDAGVRAKGGSSKPHPRGSGNNARVLGRYVRERKTISLPLAIRKMTQLPAEVFGLAGRGVIQKGAHADLTLFDPLQVKDQATYTEPRKTPLGIPYVLVNGVVVIDGGKYTGKLPGKVLRRGAR